MRVLVVAITVSFSFSGICDCHMGGGVLVWVGGQGLEMASLCVSGYIIGFWIGDFPPLPVPDCCSTNVLQ